MQKSGVGGILTIVASSIGILVGLVLLAEPVFLRVIFRSLPGAVSPSEASSTRSGNLLGAAAEVAALPDEIPGDEMNLPVRIGDRVAQMEGLKAEPPKRSQGPVGMR